LKGKVKWFDSIRGYGFLLAEDGNEHFVHISDVKYSGYDTLIIDEIIEYTLSKYETGYKAINLKKILPTDDKEVNFHKFLEECLTNKELEVAAEKGKGDIQIEQAVGFILKETSPFKVIDYGCGKGRLLEGLRTLDETCRNNLTYIGINKEIPSEAKSIASTYAIKSEFYTTEEFEQIDLKVKYICLINVLHEIPLNELPSRLYHIFKSLEIGGWVYIHDLLKLIKGENVFVNWDSEDIAQLFDPASFDIITRPHHLTHSDIGLTTVAAQKRASTNYSINDLTIKCNEIFEFKKNKILSKIEELYNLPQKSPNDVAHLQYLQLLNTNIDRQIRESEILRNGQYEACLLRDDIPNPYDFEHPVLGDQFYGRGTELKRLRNALTEGRSVAIYGLQRIGKTSLVENVVASKIGSSQENIIVKINMFEVSETCLSYINFFSSIVEGLCDHFGTDYLQAKEAFSMYLKSTDITELKHGFKKVIKEVKIRLNKKRFILFIDEFQDIIKAFEYAKKKNVANPLNSEFIRFIGSMAKERLIQLVVCCRYHIFRYDKEYDFQLLKMMTDIWLGVLDERSAENLIRRPVNDVIKYESQAIREIIVLTGCHPYLIQYLCYELFEEAKRKKVALIKETDVEYIVKKIMTEPISEPKFRVLCEDFQQIDNAKPWELLLVLADFSKNTKQNMSVDDLMSKYKSDFKRKDTNFEIQQFIELLTKSRIVQEERKDNKLFYYVLPDMLRRWLRIYNCYQKHLKSF